MSVAHALLLGLVLAGPGERPAAPADVARLRELLQDRQHPNGQSQAALLLLQDRSTEAEAVARQGLRQTESVEPFLALAAAVRLRQDGRFTEELLRALGSTRPAIRQSATEALAALAGPEVVLRLQALAQDARVELPVRQAALAALGRNGRKAAALVLLDQLSNDDPTLRQAAADALAELTGQAFGLDIPRWREWWERHKDMTEENWLEERLGYQTSRAHRLEGDLERARGQVIRLHQQLYARLPAADRLNYVQGLVDLEDPAVRALAVSWSVEQLAGTSGPAQRTIADTLLRLSGDGDTEVQRAAVLALGRVSDPRAFDRLCVLLGQAPAAIRAVAARGLAQQARGTGPEAQARQRQAVPLLQKALQDPALEVVVSAAEDLGTLGVPEAGPILAALLRHPSESVRLTAAQALERVADAAVLEGLLVALDDSAATVRFSVVAALGHACGDGKTLSDAQKTRLLTRLEALVQQDADPGVRSRAATVLGECGPPTLLPVLWRRVLANEDGRVQEKAWAAVIEILARSGNPALVQEWQRKLQEANQPARRVQLLAEVGARWQKRDDLRPAAIPVLETLIQVHLEQGKWTAAWPLTRDLLTQAAGDADVERRLGWLLTAGQQALKEGNRAEALHIIQDAQAFLPRSRKMAPDFERLQKQAQ